MAALVSGCSKGKPPATQGKSNSTAPDIPISIQTLSPGQALEYVAGPPRRLAYEINFRSGGGNATDSQHFDLTLQGVSGRLFKKGLPVAAFDADTGTAVHATGLLTLKGNVHIRSIDPKSPIKGAVMTCDTVTYRTSDEIIKAHGNISIDGTEMRGSGFEDLWCSNDLDRIATPDLYRPVRHNLPSPALHK